MFPYGHVDNDYCSVLETLNFMSGLEATLHDKLQFPSPSAQGVWCIQQEGREMEAGNLLELRKFV